MNNIKSWTNIVVHWKDILDAVKLRDGLMILPKGIKWPPSIHAARVETLPSLLILKHTLWRETVPQMWDSCQQKMSGVAKCCLRIHLFTVEQFEQERKTTLWSRKTRQSKVAFQVVPTSCWLLLRPAILQLGVGPSITYPKAPPLPCDEGLVTKTGAVSQYQPIGGLQSRWLLLDVMMQDCCSVWMTCLAWTKSSREQTGRWGFWWLAGMSLVLGWKCAWRGTVGAAPCRSTPRTACQSDNTSVDCTVIVSCTWSHCRHSAHVLHGDTKENVNQQQTVPFPFSCGSSSPGRTQFRVLSSTFQSRR